MDVYDLQAKIALDTSEYTKGLDEASNKSSTFKDVLKANFVFDFIKTGLSTATNAVKGFVKDSINVGMNFDKSMSQVAATMGLSMEQIQNQVGTVDTAYGKFTGNLREYAEFMGAKTAFSATQAADALNYMALAGYDAQTSMQMLPNVLNLAAAGGMELAQASDMVTDAQSALGLDLKQTNELVNMMATTSSKSNTSVSQLGEAILTVGGTAKTLCGGTTELNTVLGILADNGIKGAEGGTHLRNAILALSSPTDKAAKMLKRLGVETVDAKGNLLPLQDITQSLSASLEGMGSAEKADIISTIFNKTDIAAVNALLDTSKQRWVDLSTEIDGAWLNMDKFKDNLSAVGINYDSLGKSLKKIGISQKDFEDALKDSKGSAEDFALYIGEWSAKGTDFNDVLSDMGISLDDIQKAMDETTGSAQAMADTQLDNLAGDVTLFQSALEGAQIALSEGLAPTLRGFVEFGTDSLGRLTDAFKAGGLSGAMKELGTIGKDAVSKLIASFSEGVPKAMTKAGEIMESLGNGLKTGIPKILPVALNAIMEFSGNLRENASKLVDSGLDLILKLAQGLMAALPSLIETVPTIVSNIAGIINDNAPKLIPAAISLIVTLASGIIAAVPTLLENFPKIIKMIVDVMTAFNWMQLGGKIITGMANGIKTLITSIPKLIKNIATNSSNVIKSFNWLDVGKHIIKIIVNGIKSLVNSIPNTLKSIGHAAMNAFKGIDWVSLGVNVINGIVSGISNGVSKVTQAAKNVAQSAYDAAKNLLGIHSPSRKFMWIGQMVDEGYAKGIDDNSDKVEKAMKSLTDIDIDTDSIDFPKPKPRGDGTGAGTGGNNITINVYGAEGQDERTLADIIADRINNAANQELLVWS